MQMFNALFADGVGDIVEGVDKADDDVKYRDEIIESKTKHLKFLFLKLIPFPSRCPFPCR